MREMVKSSESVLDQAYWVGEKGMNGEMIRRALAARVP